MLIHGSELVAVAQGAGGILGLSVDFLGSTIRSQKSEHVTARAFALRRRQVPPIRTSRKGAGVKCSAEKWVTHPDTTP